MGKGVVSAKWFITISKFNSGLGLEKQDIIDILKLKFYTKDAFVVEEHENKKHQTFHHLHMVVWNKKSQRQDNVLRTLKQQLKKLNLYNHTKDLDVRGCLDDKTLIAGYLTKQDNYTIHKNTLSDKYIEECKVYAKTIENRKCILKGRKCPSLNEAPYTIYEFIQRHNIEYDQSWSSFKHILKQMYLSHEYSLVQMVGKFTKIKMTIDTEYYDNDIIFNRMLDNEHLKDMDTYQCKNLHIEHNNIVQHHHPLEAEPIKTPYGAYDGKDHIPILSYDDKVNFEKWGET